MIIYTSGDLLASEAQALVNAVNCEGVMGKGIAYQFKQKFPINYDSYKLLCNNYQFNIGDIYINKENGKFIINFPTKDRWRKKSEYSFIEEGLKELRKKIIDLNIKSIAVPPLGCGNGGLIWDKVESLIKIYLSDLDEVTIYLFPPAKTDGNKLSVEHLLVIHASNRLKNNTRYNIYASLYLAQEYCGGNLFKFDYQNERLLSKQINKISDDIKKIKLVSVNRFDSIVDEYINKNINKKIEGDFHSYNYEMEKIIKIINSFNSKNETLIFVSLIYLLKENNYQLTMEELFKNINDNYDLREVTTIFNILTNNNFIYPDMLGHLKIK